MHLDVTQLNKFYFGTQLGEFACRVLQARVVDLWPDLTGRTVVGFGFAVPLFGDFVAAASRTICLMPASQGVMPWPIRGPNASVLTDEANWPLPTGSVDRILLLHGLESSESPSLLLEECWRTLAPEGRLLAIVPNRAGMWARKDATPFGQGRPYSAGQIENELAEHRFELCKTNAALFIPPSRRQFWLSVGPAWERVGKWMPRGLAGGVHLAEATKRLYAPHRPGLSETVKNRIEALKGIAAPGARPVSGRSLLTTVSPCTGATGRTVAACLRSGTGVQSTARPKFDRVFRNDRKMT